MKKRLYATLLALCLMMTLLPTMALAEDKGVTTEAELRAAIENATGTETDPTIIHLSKSIELNSSIEIPDGKYIELVGTLNDITISPSASFASSVFAPALIVIGHGANATSNTITSLVLKDIVLDGDNRTRGITIHKGNYLTTEDVVIKNGAAGAGSSGGGIAVCWHGETGRAQLSLSNTEIYGCAAGDSNSSTKGKYGGAINTYGNADVTLNNVNFHENYASWSGSAIYQGTLMLSGNIVLGKNDNGNGVFDSNISIAGTLGDSSEIYIAEPASRTVIATAKDGYKITQADFQKFILKYVQYNNINAVDQYALYLDKSDNAIKMTNAVTVTLHANNGTNETIEQKVPEGIETWVKENPFAYPGHTFVEWNTADDGTGDSYKTDVAQTFLNDKTLYAKWKLRTLSEVTVVPAENAEFVFGSTLNAADFIVTEVYDNGETVIVEPENYTVSPAELTSAGSVDVEILYNGATYTCPISVEKAEQAKPTAPTLKDRSYTSITLDTIEGAQYRCNGGAWQTSPEFTGLTAGTAYTFEARYPETDDYKESPASDAAEFSTLQRSSGSSSSSSSGSYAVSAPSAKNGDVTVSPKTAKKGDTVTITVIPDKGYELDTITVKDASGNKLKLTDKGNGKYTFTMPGSKVTVAAQFVEAQAVLTFADVPTDAYYAEAVKWAVDKGIANGKSNGLFGSNDPCTRGQIVTFLWRAAGAPTPKGTATVPADVLPGSYCYDAVAWALENGIANGFADGTFGVNSPCTRGQSVTFLYRALGTAPTTVNGFTDVASDAFCAEAVAWAVENDVTNGTSATTFSPADGCTRAQIVTFLYRAYQGK